ncbi:MAG: hypothetical protein HN392_02215 [Anaerolineae bacterium]|nr:hypothetical protein [Anaerolineae bacterium]MBT7074022.1 hypothetical protein [Anaerolineae bacterium]MBT7781704.1 hypothetical protein [Anaerolineae bacterium]
MNTRKLFIVILIALFLFSCNLPTNTPVETKENTEVSPILENTATSIPPTAPFTPIPSDTPPPTNTPLPTATFTPTVPIALPKDQNVNCRYGYGTDWLAIAALVTGQPATIKGKNASGTWWYISPPNAPGTSCWVADSVTKTAGNLAGLPVYDQSTASVIAVSIEKPDTISVGGCIGPLQPITLGGSIQTNGPGTVDWHFETEQGGALANHTNDFSEAGSKSFTESFLPTLTVGDYWIKLVVTGPNGKVAESSYKIECP